MLVDYGASRLAKQKRRGKCIFCPHDGTLTLEDAIPKWVQREFNERRPPKGQWALDRHHVRDFKLVHSHSKIVGGLSVYKLPVVCGECNSGWMSRLENRVKPILLPTMFGEATELGTEAQEGVATWLTKTALLFDLLATESTLASAADRRWFGEHQKPMSASSMWMGAYDGDLAIGFHFRRLIDVMNRDLSPPVQTHDAQILTLGLGFLVLQIILPVSERRVATQYRRPEPNDYLFQLWPTRARQSWPPRKSFDDLTLPSFTKP